MGVCFALQQADPQALRYLQQGTSPLFFSRSHKDAPGANRLGQGLKKQQLHLPPARSLGHDARMPHATVVDHQKVSWLNPMNQVAHMPVLGFILENTVHQKARRIPRFCRSLGDPIRGQLVVKVAEFHAPQRIESRPRENRSLTEPVSTGARLECRRWA